MTTSTRWLLILVLCVGATLRLMAALDPAPELIERDEFIPAALTLSPEHHPIRVAQHGALPAYAIRVSGALFGNTLVGWRMASVIAGTATILLVFLTATTWWGRRPGLVAAALLAVERYHVEISGRAIDLPFDLFFFAFGLFAFSRFLNAADHGTSSAAARWLGMTAIASGLGFLCKEFTALLLPTLLLSLALMGRWAWFRRPQLWASVVLFVLIISPDVYSSLTVTREERVDLWQRHQEAAASIGVTITADAYKENGLYMSYGDQLSRFRSIDLNREPFYFYFGGLLDAIGVPHQNGFDEFPFLHPALGLLLWLGLAWSVIAQTRDGLTVVLVTVFAIFFVPFALVELGAPRARFPTDSGMLWYWVDRTMFPAILLTGRSVADVIERLQRRGRPRISP